MIYKKIFLDTETTGNEAKDYLCQLAFKENDYTYSELFKPPLPISVESSAVCHITNKMVENCLPFQESPDYLTIKKRLEDVDAIVIAHNAQFDLGMLTKESIVPQQHICTMRLARALDTEGVIPKYNLQYLRYYLGIEVEATAHDALGDVLVLEKLFERLYAKVKEKIGSDNDDMILDEMIRISSEPSLIKTIGFGKHAGKKLEEVARIDPGYLEWLLAQKVQSDTNEEDWIYTLKYYLKK